MVCILNGSFDRGLGCKSQCIDQKKGLTEVSLVEIKTMKSKVSLFSWPGPLSFGRLLK